MAKKRATTEALLISVTNMEEARQALEEIEAIEREIRPKMNRAVDLKKAVTNWAVGKKVNVVQLEDAYYRRIQRNTTLWVLTDEDMPEKAPKNARSIKSIVAGKKVKFKGKMVPLWQLVTKRVVDPIGIDHAVSQGWIKEKEIGKALLEKPQAPFLQRYEGEAQDG